MRPAGTHRAPLVNHHGGSLLLLCIIFYIALLHYGVRLACSDWMRCWGAESLADLACSSFVCVVFCAFALLLMLHCIMRLPHCTVCCVRPLLVSAWLLRCLLRVWIVGLLALHFVQFVIA